MEKGITQSNAGGDHKLTEEVNLPSVSGASSVGQAEAEDKRMKLVLEFTTDIIDKQYRSYVWNDGKVQALVTIDTALIAGILLILQVFSHVSTFAFILLGCSFVCLLISSLVCLVHAVPKIDSGVGNQSNLRTMVGISPLSKQQYHEAMLSQSLDKMIEMNCWQITGMCKNNMRSHHLIRRGVRLTISGVLALAVALLIIVFSSWSSRRASEAGRQPVADTTSKKIIPPAKLLRSLGQESSCLPCSVPHGIDESTTGRDSDGVGAKTPTHTFTK